MTTTRMTRYDRAMVRLLNDRRSKPMYATAARRRLVVALHAVLTVVIGSLLALFTLAGARPLWPAVLAFVLLLPWTVATGVINGATRGLLELRARALDERQLTERSRVLAVAHRAMTVLLAAAVAGLLIAGAAGGGTPETAVVPVLAAVLVAHWLMPLWVAGLRAQDEPADDEAIGA
ncbi:hypothetical protein SUDANB58_03019 [Streptomyces sp. enrichment culture]|uniref:hypothetical protein n=1 Tax=Streptomyces sp. enrichment culture TaxID=1795815 RepID=UPI003F571772